MLNKDRIRQKNNQYYRTWYHKNRSKEALSTTLRHQEQAEKKQRKEALLNALLTGVNTLVEAQKQPQEKKITIDLL